VALRGPVAEPHTRNYAALTGDRKQYFVCAGGRDVITVAHPFGAKIDSQRCAFVMVRAAYSMILYDLVEGLPLSCARDNASSRR
jgi:hypothetical protein